MSNLEHIAKILWMSEWRRGVLAMFTAAFDVSGAEHDRPVLVVAGFTADVGTWLSFGVAWKERLAQDDLDYFHMTEFVRSKGIFSKWKDDPRRWPLLKDLVGIIRSHACRQFGCGIKISDLHEFTSQANRDRFLMHAYPIAGRSSMVQVVKWALRERIASPEVVFDQGEHRQLNFVGNLEADGEIIPIFKRNRDYVDNYGNHHEGFLPLQAADVLAYIHYARITQDGKVADEVNWTHDALNSIPGSLTAWDDLNLDRLERRMKEAGDLRDAGARRVQ